MAMTRHPNHRKPTVARAGYSDLVRRHVEDSLAERRDMREWIRRARTLTRVVVGERDWLRWGHLSPEEWLHEGVYARQHEEDMTERDDWESYHEGPYDDREGYRDEWDPAVDMDCWEPMQDQHAEFAGRLYPREHVEDAATRIWPPAG